MYLGRVTGRLVATVRYEGMDDVKLQLLEPLDEAGGPTGEQLVAACALSVGPGDLVHYVDGREAALALPDETFVPVDVAITGFVEQADVNGEELPLDALGRPAAREEPDVREEPAVWEEPDDPQAEEVQR